MFFSLPLGRKGGVFSPFPLALQKPPACLSVACPLACRWRAVGVPLACRWRAVPTCRWRAVPTCRIGRGGREGAWWQREGVFPLRS